MDSKPPTFDGDIDGVMFNSFLFQFESYFTFKWFDLELDGVTVGQELGQCVRKSAITWYEAFMQRPDTPKTWTAMKYALEKNFKEPNFQQKFRSALLNIKQRGSYHGYVAKFQEQLRLAPLEPIFAKEVFLKGLTSASLRKQILRKNPASLEEAIAECFAEEALNCLDDAKPDAAKIEPSDEGSDKCHRKAKGYRAESTTGKFQQAEVQILWGKDKESRFCQRPPSDSVDYNAKYYALVDRLVIDDVSSPPSPLNE
ncbi:hypothetical protein PHMEG_00017347 [Phytophthora megakarya]|uniref:Retrotransposon gag domain-containing protein n=1 Tax=Phytophthora megakarya TaxID=4795 RepID=A0A225VWQ9_9STRA|nr:hypothetical protein PHMEG_00017347 [Phytophthora megakarya]